MLGANVAFGGRTTAGALRLLNPIPAETDAVMAATSTDATTTFTAVL